MHKVLIDANTFKDIKDIYIVITHTHIKDLNKSKLVLMHFNTIDLYEQAIKDTTYSAEGDFEAVTINVPAYGVVK